MNTNHPLATTLFMTLGAASTCWENMENTGTFDSPRCQELGIQLLRAIDAHVAACLKEATEDVNTLREERNDLRRAQQLLSSSYIRIRSMVRALNTSTAPTVEDVYLLTEDRVKQLVSLGTQFANLGFNLQNYKPGEITQEHLNSLASLTNAWDKEFK